MTLFFLFPFFPRPLKKFTDLPPQWYVPHAVLLLDSINAIILLFNSDEIHLQSKNKKERVVKEDAPLGPQHVRVGEEVFGVAHIYATFNDTFVHITDLTGRETIVRVTGTIVSCSKPFYFFSSCEVSFLLPPRLSCVLTFSNFRWYEGEG
tara:strand:+ start:319 stop:768 length:450 start_codon:yes stop_codon:yes gene_type:complete